MLFFLTSKLHSYSYRSFIRAAWGLSLPTSVLWRPFWREPGLKNARLDIAIRRWCDCNIWCHRKWVRSTGVSVCSTSMEYFDIDCWLFSCHSVNSFMILYGYVFYWNLINCWCIIVSHLSCLINILKKNYIDFNTENSFLLYM